MEIFFKTKKIAELCNQNNKTIKELSANGAKKLQLRLSQLFSVKNLKDMQYGRPHPLTGKRKGQFAVNISDGARLVFEAVEPIPKTADGSTDWREVATIRIVFIGDYHG